MCTISPAPARTCSPAMSEISVGSPSPPPPPQPVKLGLQLTPIAALRAPSAPFQPPAQLKRIRLASNNVCAITPSVSQSSSIKRHKQNSMERIKSFNIADILGKNEEFHKSASPLREDYLKQPVTAVQNESLLTQIPQLIVPTLIPSIPNVVTIPTATTTSPLKPLIHPTALPGPLPLRPFYSPAHLIHYEQRLAWDYQRQLQEHFQIQAQLLRQMSMDPNIIQSEDGSERDSHSSSTGSACCSPEVNVEGNGDGDDPDELADVTKSKINSNDDIKTLNGDTPLDALFQLSTKNFDEEQDPATLSIFATRQHPKKKRKSRTAFTNHQIFELEKRFLYQKYLSPADRDEIAAGLGLSNAQVITWFQNRRAKLKRDMEELKKDVESVKQLSAHKSFLENVNDLNILKTRPVSRQHQQTTAEISAGLPPSPTTLSTAAATTATSTTTTRALNYDNRPKLPTYIDMATTSNSRSTAQIHRPSSDDIRENSNQQPRLQQHNNRG